MFEAVSCFQVWFIRKIGKQNAEKVPVSMVKGKRACLLTKQALLKMREVRLVHKELAFGNQLTFAGSHFINVHAHRDGFKSSLSVGQLFGKGNFSSRIDE